MTIRLHSGGDPSILIVAGFILVLPVVALLSPGSAWLMGIGVLAGGVALLAWRHPLPYWALWTVIAGLTPEMALTDLIGPEAFQPVIVLVKGGEIALTALLILRFGFAPDLLNPGWAFVFMAAASGVAGVHAELTRGDMLRSLFGSLTPFLVFFCVKPPGWSQAIRRAVVLAPLTSVAIGGVLALAGLRPVFVESGGIRLAGLGHPAFLAGVCLTALYAALLDWLREGSRRAAVWMAVNLALLILTGARAPIVSAAAVLGFSLVFAPSTAVPRAHRLILLLAGFAVLPAVFVFGEQFTGLRLFTLMAGEAGHLSGRDLLWPVFEAAADQAPWFGLGLGSGNLIIPPDGPVARLLHTWAAHNEYLRLMVEGGQIGRALLIGLFAVWIFTRTAILPALEKRVTRLIFLAFAAHAVTDNVLISTPACVFFTLIAAVFADTRQKGVTERYNDRLREARHVA